MTDELRVWTDGACKGNPGPGGWAWVDEHRAWASGGEARSTNQRMEVLAAHRAIVDHADHDGTIHVISDSTYVVNCFRDRWWAGWLKRGWTNSQKKPVANRDLWEPLIELYQARGDITFEWVKGHSGDPMNDAADRLAVVASSRLTDASGADLPTDLDEIGEEDAPGGVPDAAGAVSAGGRDPRLPEGRLLGIFGVRPTELGGYDANAVSDRTSRRIQQIVAAKQRMHPDLHVVSGLRLGVEQLGAEAALEERVPLVAVLPFPAPDAMWPEASRRRFAQTRGQARSEILLERKTPDTRQRIGAALARRDAWLARNIDEALVVWDGKDPFVGRLVRTLRDHLGDDVWEELVEPF